jgi:hypothetical protein
MAEYKLPDFEESAIKYFKTVYKKSEEAPAGSSILNQLLSIAELLIEKNISYGSSFDKPIGVFSKQKPLEQLFVRIDDKLNRIKHGKNYASEDTILDLIGYLVLLRILLDER